VTPPGADPAEDALDALIEQERKLIDRFDARKSSADSTAAAAVTGVLALAAVAATGAQTITGINKTFAWIVAFVLATVCIVALIARFLAGLAITNDAGHDERKLWGISSRSAAYNAALAAMRQCGAENHLNPVEVRRRILAVCRALATDTERAAESKERWAAAASLALAVALLLTGLLALTLGGK
jgi:hypothetical protein